MRTHQGALLLAAAAALTLVPGGDAFLPSAPLPTPAAQLQQQRMPTAAAVAPIQQRRPLALVCAAAGEDADYPSDTGAEDSGSGSGSSTGGVSGGEASSSSESFSAEGAKAQVRDSLKCQIYKMGAKTNRGQLANLDQQNEIINLVAQLEALGSTRPLDPTDIEGRWELVYSDVAPFRVSPFFMTVGKVMGSSSLSPEDFFRLHRLATSGSEIGRVRQIITSSELVSEVEITTGIPSVPFAIQGTVVSRATAERSGANALKLTFKSTSIQGSSLFPFLNGGDLPELPLSDLAGRLGLSPPPVTMTTYYADANMRISRTEDDHFFVFARGSL